MTMKRKDKVDYYLDVAKAVAQRSPCARRKVGAIIVKNDTVVGVGYNGSARGVLNCGTDIPCLKNLSNEPHLTSYANCSGVHAEDNAISAAGWDKCKDATMYLYVQGNGATQPCFQCRRKILNAQLRDIWYIGDDGNAAWTDVEELKNGEIAWQYGKLDMLGAKAVDVMLK
jgi:dCMP deaminase